MEKNKQSDPEICDGAEAVDAADVAEAPEIKVEVDHEDVFEE